jgi:hypothetical protein
MNQPYAVAGALGHKADLVAANGAQLFAEGTTGVDLSVTVLYDELAAIGANDAALHQA